MCVAHVLWRAVLYSMAAWAIAGCASPPARRTIHVHGIYTERAELVEGMISLHLAGLDAVTRAQIRQVLSTCPETARVLVERFLRPPYAVTGRPYGPYRCEYDGLYECAILASQPEDVGYMRKVLGDRDAPHVCRVFAATVLLWHRSDSGATEFLRHALLGAKQTWDEESERIDALALLSRAQLLCGGELQVLTMADLVELARHFEDPNYVTTVPYPSPFRHFVAKEQITGIGCTARLVQMERHRLAVRKSSPPGNQTEKPRAGN